MELDFNKLGRHRNRRQYKHQGFLDRFDAPARKKFLSLYEGSLDNPDKYGPDMWLTDGYAELEVKSKWISGDWPYKTLNVLERKTKWLDQAVTMVVFNNLMTRCAVFPLDLVKGRRSFKQAAYNCKAGVQLRSVSLEEIQYINCKDPKEFKNDFDDFRLRTEGCRS